MNNLTLKESIAHCIELINVNFPVFLWTYEKDLSLSPQQLTNYQPFNDILEMLDLKKHVTANMITTGDPIILENRFGLVNILCFSRKESKITVCGPLYMSVQTSESIRKRMEDSGMSVTETNMAMMTVTDLSVMPFIQMIQTALMLDYCLNHEKLDRDRVRFHSTMPYEEPINAKKSTDDPHAGIYENEQKFVHMIENGSIQAVSMLRELAIFSKGMKVRSKDILRNDKNNFLILLTIVSRAAIKGGMPPALSYTLNDHYGTLIDQQRSTSEVAVLSEKMVTDYVTRLHRQKHENGISMEVQDACEWILSHLDEDLSIERIAEKEGYTTYYFSRVFKKEMGQSILSWIRYQRIVKAKDLLTSTNLSIDSINEKVNFGSREYFSSSFHKETGFSPMEYRIKAKKSH